ncbi:MAG: hypothetical protein JWO31_421 [Phycisphaerales bacterium]|nr:hypothetical protein [Phycisphaerales bacterium]
MTAVRTFAAGLAFAVAAGCRDLDYLPPRSQPVALDPGWRAYAERNVGPCVRDSHPPADAVSPPGYVAVSYVPSEDATVMEADGEADGGPGPAHYFVVWRRAGRPPPPEADWGRGRVMVYTFANPADRERFDPWPTRRANQPGPGEPQSLYEPRPGEPRPLSGPRPASAPTPVPPEMERRSNTDPGPDDFLHRH